MKKLIYVFIACILFSNIISAQAEDKWFTIKDTDAAYSIQFPKEPIKGADDVETGNGTVKMNTYTLQLDNDVNLIYMSSFTKYPDSFFPDRLDSIAKQKEVLENSINGAVTNTNGKLILDESIIFNGYNGKKAKIEVDGGYIINMQVLLVGVQLYITQIIYSKEDDGNTGARRFFDSFELIN